MNFLASKWLGCTRCLQVFVIKWHARSSSKKKQNSHFFPSFFPSQILFFSPQAPPMSKHNKNLHAACRPEPLWCQKISYFFEFSCYFLNLLFIGLHIYCFSSDTSSWNVWTTRKFARTLRTWVSLIPQIFRFFRMFLLFFSGRSKPFDRLWPALTGR